MSLAQIANINLSKYLKNSTTSYSNSLEQLSSGYKYTSLAQNPTVVSEASNLSIRISSNNILQSNISIGQDMLTSTSAYQETIIDNVQRIKDLVLQVQNGTYTTEDNDQIYKEISSRLEYINNLSKNANFNGTNLLDGSATNVKIKIGQRTDEFVDISSLLMDSSSSGLNIDIGVTSAAGWNKSNLDDYMSRLDTAMITLTKNCSKIAATTSQLDYINDNLTQKTTALTEYKSNIIDTDTAEASAELVQNQIKQEAATQLFTQSISMLKYKAQLLLKAS